MSLPCRGRRKRGRVECIRLGDDGRCCFARRRDRAPGLSSRTAARKSSREAEDPGRSSGRRAHSALPAQFVAVASSRTPQRPPSFSTVDTATKNFTVRKVGAAPKPEQKLRAVAGLDKLQRPRSLGVIGGSDYVRP